jgi:hypothetical protein
MELVGAAVGSCDMARFYQRVLQLHQRCMGQLEGNCPQQLYVA